MTDEPQEKKIIVDEDWKSQVEAEREAARRKQETPKADESPKAPAGPMPPPSLQLLATSLGLQAMIALGAMANPATGKVEVSLEHAKHTIDTIDMLMQKTAGNRTPEETEVLEGLLHELRMGYVASLGKSGQSPVHE
jgi:hypothetical protein